MAKFLLTKAPGHVGGKEANKRTYEEQEELDLFLFSSGARRKRGHRMTISIQPALFSIDELGYCACVIMLLAF